MGDDEARREAEHLAAALSNLSEEMGAGATIWARAAQDVLALHESARESFNASPATQEDWQRLHSSALMLVVAIDQVLAFQLRVSGLTDDDELAQARASFDVACPGADALRDLVAHLDAYAVGEGFRQTGRRHPPLGDEYAATFIYWGEGSSTVLDLGDQRMNLRRAADAAIELADVVERVRARHQERAAREADAALRRLYGLPPA